MISKKIYNIISYGYIGILTYALLIPLDSKVITQIIQEKNHPNNITSFYIHIILFFLLYFICHRTFNHSLKFLFFCIFYSIIIETLQLLTNRGFQIYDIFFNIIGIFIAYIFLNFYYKKNIQ